MNSQKGVTLIEAIICLVIISLISAIGYPRMIDWAQRMSFRADVNSLVRNIHKAQIEAIKANTYVVLKLFPDGYDIFVDNGVGTAKRGDWVRQQQERELIHFRFKDRITLSNNFTLNRTRFTGRPGVKAGTIILDDNNGPKMKVIVNAIGKVRVM